MITENSLVIPGNMINTTAVCLLFVFVIAMYLVYFLYCLTENRRDIDLLKGVRAKLVTRRRKEAAMGGWQFSEKDEKFLRKYSQKFV